MSFQLKRSFLAIPVWRQFRRLKPYTPVIRRSLIVGLGVFVVYTLTVLAGSLAIYHFHKENAFTRGVEHIFPYPAAIVRGEIIPLSRFRVEVEAREHYANLHGQTVDHSATERFVREQLITWTLYSQALADAHIAIDEAGLQKQLNDIYTQAGSKEAFQTFLTQEYGSRADLNLFMGWMRGAASEAAVQQKLLTNVTIRHILVSLPANPSDDQVATALAKANDIRSSLGDSTDSAKFADVAKTRSDDVTSRDKGGLFGTTNRGDDQPVLSADFEAAVFSTPVGSLTKPVRSSYGWHIVYIEEKQGTLDLSKKAFLAKQRDAGRVRVYIGL